MENWVNFRDYQKEAKDCWRQTDLIKFEQLAFLVDESGEDNEILKSIQRPPPIGLWDTFNLLLHFT